MGNEKLKNIGLALSGGGIRAMLFHLGIFKWLAEQGLMEQVKKVSTVSGASLCVGMIYSYSNLSWPTSDDFISKALPAIKKALNTSLHKWALLNLPITPSCWFNKTKIISGVLERKWGVYGNLQDLSGNVTWYVNCTTFETGKRFRFCQKDMGDYTLGYVRKPQIKISEIMAASAGFPIFIGPYKLKIAGYNWTPYDERVSYSPPNYKYIHLWDGGVYDNLGVESIFKQANGGSTSAGVDFMIISNASEPLTTHARNGIRAIKNTRRLLNIALDQISALRTRTVMEYINSAGQGMFLKIGNSAEYITKKSNCSDALRSNLIDNCLPSESALIAQNYKTGLKRPSVADYNLILQHGYEVAKCTYQCYVER